MKKYLSKIFILLDLALCLLLIPALFVKTTCCSENLSKRDLSKLTALAKQGDVTAMHRLRFFYEESGEEEKSQYWLEQGARHGDSLAELHLANQLLDTDKPDEQLGISYLFAAAEHGQPLAQEILGERYRDGNLVERRIDLAEYWLRKSAESGSPSAMLALVDLLLKRAKAKEDYLECLEWNERGLTSPEVKAIGATHLYLTEQRERLLQDARAAGFTFL